MYIIYIYILSADPVANGGWRLSSMPSQRLFLWPWFGALPKPSPT